MLINWSNNIWADSNRPVFVLFMYHEKSSPKVLPPILRSVFYDLQILSPLEYLYSPFLRYIAIYYRLLSKNLTHRYIRQVAITKSKHLNKWC